jgi:hypothetical protein
VDEVWEFDVPPPLAEPRAHAVTPQAMSPAVKEQKIKDLISLSSVSTIYFSTLINFERAVLKNLRDIDLHDATPPFRLKAAQVNLTVLSLRCGSIVVITFI